MPVIGEIEHKSLGRVRISARPNTRRATARWKNGLVNLNVPASAGLPDINRMLNELTPRLLQCRPTLAYSPGQRLSFPGVEFLIASQRVAPGRILAKASLPLCSLEVGTDFDFADPSTTRAVSDMLCKLARRIAPEILIPRARELAASIGHHPIGWAISSGHRILGTCGANGIISLSYVLVFLPAELRDYVILHELTHLSEMNHSPRFHALLDNYLGGQEQALRARLRAYCWPVLRR